MACFKSAAVTGPPARSKVKVLVVSFELKRDGATVGVVPQRLRLCCFQLIHKGQSVADTLESRVEIVVQQRHGSHRIRVRQRLCSR